MSFRDADLRDALAPLAGDPVGDAARVLGRLPRPPLLPPVAWWLLGIGLAVGLGLGLLAGSWSRVGTGGPSRGDGSRQGPGEGEARGQGDTPTPDPDKPPPDKPPPDKPPPDKPSPDAMDWMHQFLLTPFGRVEVTEPGRKTEVLDREMYRVDLGARVDTKEGMAGMLMSGDTQLRLDTGTVAFVRDPHAFELVAGRLWVHTGQDPQAMTVVTTALGTVDVSGGTAVVEARDERLRIACLEGMAHVRPPSGASIAVRAGTLFGIGAAGREGPSDIGFLADHTGWMTQMLLRQFDRSELVRYIDRMVDAYFGERNRDAAERELRRMAPAGVPALVTRFLATPGGEPGFARRTARLIGETSGPPTRWNLFDLLYHPDPEVRAIAFTHLVRITGDDGGTDASFWRRGDNQPERERAIQEWARKAR